MDHGRGSPLSALRGGAHHAQSPASEGGMPEPSSGDTYAGVHNDVLGASEIVGQQLRDETEVEYHDPSLSGHEHIGRFDISMELSQAV